MPLRKRPANQHLFYRDNTPVIVYVTICAAGRKCLFDNDQFYQAFLAQVTAADHWLVGRYVIMPDHLHLFCAPSTMESKPVKAWISYWKSKITRQMEWPIGNFQTGGWDTQMRTKEQYESKWNYVLENPVRAGLVVQAGDWPFAGELNPLEWA